MRLPTIGLLLILASNAWAGSAHPNLVAWYRAEGNALDASGNGNTGTLVGDIGFNAGVFGSSFVFDGTNNRVDVPGIGNSNLNGNDGFTITGWVYDAGTANGRLADKSDATSSAGGFYIAIVTGNIAVNINNINRVDSPSGSVVQNEWTFVAFSVKANGDFYLSVGDTLTTGSTGSTSGITTTSGFAIGDREAGDRKMNGRLDDVRLYDAALSPSDIRRVMQGMQPLHRY